MPTAPVSTATLLSHYRWMAQYNAWINTRVYDACERLSEAECLAERGAFFGSLHNTLNHLVLGDQMWLARFRDCAQAQGWVVQALAGTVIELPPHYGLNHVLYPLWPALRAKRLQLDEAIVAWLNEAAADYPETLMRYTNTKGVVREHPTWRALSHFFNHQTHHRGQATTLLMQAGVDPGVTDLVALL